MKKTTMDNIRSEQIFTLEAEAGEHDDQEMVSICQLAIYGKTESIRESATLECIKVINDAEANADLD